MKRLDRALNDLQAGTITYTEFFRVTRNDWANMARYLHQRWPLPSWHTLEDIEQDLHVGVWTKLAKFDATRNVTLARFIVFNAVDYAKKQAHKSRGARYTGKGVDWNPSLFDIPFSFCTRDADSDWEDFVYDSGRSRRTFTPATQFNTLYCKEVLEVVWRRKSQVEGRKGTQRKRVERKVKEELRQLLVAA